MKKGQIYEKWELTIGFSNMEVTGDLNKNIDLVLGPLGKIKKGNPMDSTTIILF